VCRADNLATFVCKLSTNYGHLNLLEPKGPVQVCVGIALLFVKDYVEYVHCAVLLLSTWKERPALCGKTCMNARFLMFHHYCRIEQSAAGRAS
jgi:hypothetical protein